MNYARKGNGIRREQAKRVLGKTAGELDRIMGEPSVSYSYRDNEVFLYDSKPVKTVSLRNGVVVKCDDYADSRRYIRVQPIGSIPVLAMGKDKDRGTLKDISISGVAVSHDGIPFAAGDRVLLAFALPIEGIDRFIEIPCRVHNTRNGAEGATTVFNFDYSGGYHKKRLVARYVSLRKAQVEMELDDSFFL